MDSKYSRKELLEWLRREFGSSAGRIEDCKGGEVYLSILDRLYPNVVPLQRVNWSPHSDYDYQKNYRILQDVMRSVKLSRGINVENLAKGRYQDHLEFLQWLRGLFDKKCPDGSGLPPTKPLLHKPSDTMHGHKADTSGLRDNKLKAISLLCSAARNDRYLDRELVEYILTSRDLIDLALP